MKTIPRASFFAAALSLAVAGAAAAADLPTAPYYTAPAAFRP